VIRWFLDVGLEYRLIDPKKYYEYFNVSLIGIGIRGIPEAVLMGADSSPAAHRVAEPERVTG
jgi:hypothetical protein